MCNTERIKRKLWVLVAVTHQCQSSEETTVSTLAWPGKSLVGHGRLSVGWQGQGEPKTLLKIKIYYRKRKRARRVKRQNGIEKKEAVTEFV